MSQIQSIHSLLSGIINGQQSRLAEIKIKHSKLSLDILNVLYEEGYIRDYRVHSSEGHKIIIIKLKYYNNSPAIKNIERISKNNISLKLLDLVDLGLVTYILSTSKGIMSGKEARRLRIGGTILVVVW